MRTRLVSLLPLALSACTMIPQTAPPRQAVPAAWNDSAGRRAAASAADTPWWTAFPDTTLRGLIRAALARNTDVRAAAENVTTAGDYLRMAQAALFPVLTASGSAATQGSRYTSRVSGYATGPSHSGSDQYSARLSLSWDPDPFGVTRSGIAAARARRAQALEWRRDVALAVVAQTASTYADLRANDLVRAVLDSALADRLRVVGLAQRRAGSAPAASLEDAEARAEVEKVRRALIDVAESATHDEYALSLLIGRSPGAILRPEVRAQALVAAPVPVSLPGTLLQRRPDVRAAERELEAAAADVGQRKAQLLPRIALSAGGGLSWSATRSEIVNASTGQTASNRTTGDSRTWSLGASLSQTLFAGGYYRAGVRAAESRADYASIAYEAVVLRALLDAEDALASVRFAAQRRASLDSQVVLTRMALQLAEGRYERGEGPFLEVLFAQGASLSAETGAVYAWRTELLALIDLYRALGGGWESAEASGASSPKP